MKSDSGERAEQKLASLSSNPNNINWKGFYDEAVGSVAIYVDGASTTGAIQNGLRQQTFGDEISIEIRRKVLRQLVGRVCDRDDITVDEVIAAHKEAVESVRTTVIHRL